jgi:hypothetical protein
VAIGIENIDVSVDFNQQIEQEVMGRLKEIILTVRRSKGQNHRHVNAITLALLWCFKSIIYIFLLFLYFEYKSIPYKQQQHRHQKLR